MNKNAARTLLLLLTALCRPAVAASNAAPALIELGQDRAVYPVVSAQVLTDPTRTLTIDQVRLMEKAGTAAWQTVTRFNFGYSTARRWLKVTVANRDSASADWFLELGYPLIQGVEFHQFSGARHVAGYKTGRLLPFSSRPVPYHNFLFPVTIPKGGVTELYLMAESNGTVFVPLSLSTRGAFLGNSVRKTTAIGLYVGIIAAMVLYNLFLLFAFRDRNYLLYIGYAATFCLLMSSLNGTTYQYLWPDWPKWNMVSVPVLVGISYLFLALFTRSFLETKKLAPRLDIGLDIVIAGAAFLILGGVFHYGLFVNRFTSLFISAVPLVMIPISVRCMQRGSHVAIYYLMAFGCFFLGSGTHAARDMGWLPQNFATENGPYLGSATEMLLLSLGLAARIKRLKDRLAQQLAVSAFASQVAHDIRSPLAALDAIERDLSQLAEGKRVILRSAVSRIRDIANSLLAKHDEIKAALSEAPRTPASSPEPTSLELLSSLIEGILTEKRLQFQAKLGVAIEAELGSGAYGLFARLAPAAFKRDLSNLVNNAVEAVGDRGRVLVSLASAGDRVVLKITDDGPGIPAEILTKLGERGYTHGKPGGLGLGIHHAKVDAAAWGGTLDIRSQPGQGTTISLRLPRAEPPAWFVPRLELREGGVIIVIDDDATIHQVWQGRFDSLRAKEKGVEIHHFFRASELFAWCKANPQKARHALYLVDYELLGGSQSGLDLIAELGLNGLSILVTSRAEESEIVQRCVRMGVRMIPKGLAGFVPAMIVEEPAAPDAVLVDDDQLVHLTWKLAAESKGIRLGAFSSGTEVLAAAKDLPRRTPIYLDYDLGDGVEGTKIAQDLHALGFRELYLATGRAPDSALRRPWIKRVIGKEPPW
jgi:signal transduction histidine kinase/CheY-like chemotaxis protein